MNLTTRRRRLAVMAVLAASAVGLAACGGGKVHQASASQNVTLTILTHTNPATQKAMDELATAGDAVLPALRQTLASGRSLEVRRRCQDLLESWEWRIPGAEELRALRAIAILEKIGNREARELLQELARGDPGARRSQLARIALDRLTRRPSQ